MDSNKIAEVIADLYLENKKLKENIAALEKQIIILNARLSNGACNSTRAD